MKTYIITLSERFPTTHQRKGQKTNFEHLFLNKKKIHTIRRNIPRWENIIRQVQRGKAILSVRKWTGKPYWSNQVEIGRLTAKDEIGIQKVVFSRSEWEEKDGQHFCFWAEIDGKEINIDNIAQNDGFSDCDDYISWFNPEIEKQKPDKEGWKHLELAVIHFTKFRY